MSDPDLLLPPARRKALRLAHGHLTVAKRAIQLGRLDEAEIHITAAMRKIGKVPK